MDQENHQILVSAEATADSAGGFWSTNLSTTLSLIPLARLASSTLNRHRIFNNDNDEDESDGGYDEPFPPLNQEWVYSKPFMVLEFIWNLAFVLVAAFVLLITVRERPSSPLRLWIAGYALQCLLHVAFVWIDYQRNIFYDDFDGLYWFSLFCHLRYVFFSFFKKFLGFCSISS